MGVGSRINLHHREIDESVKWCWLNIGRRNGQQNATATATALSFLMAFLHLIKFDHQIIAKF